MVDRSITQSAGRLIDRQTGRAGAGILGKIEHIWHDITKGKVTYVEPKPEYRNFEESMSIFRNGCFHLKRSDQRARGIVLYNISYLAKVNQKFKPKYGAKSLTHSRAKTTKLTRGRPKAFGSTPKPFGSPVGALKPFSILGKASC